MSQATLAQRNQWPRTPRGVHINVLLTLIRKTATYLKNLRVKLSASWCTSAKNCQAYHERSSVRTVSNGIYHWNQTKGKIPFDERRLYEEAKLYSSHCSFSVFQLAIEVVFVRGRLISRNPQQTASSTDTKNQIIIQILWLSSIPTRLDLPPIRCRLAESLSMEPLSEQSKEDQICVYHRKKTKGGDNK